MINKSSSEQDKRPFNKSLDFGQYVTNSNLTKEGSTNYRLPLQIQIHMNIVRIDICPTSSRDINFS